MQPTCKAKKHTIEKDFSSSMMCSCDCCQRHPKPSSQDNGSPSAFESPKLALHDCESRPVKDSECSSEILGDETIVKTDSVDSQDLAMMDVIRGMAMEEQRLTDELNQLNQKEKSYEKAMQLCSTMFTNKTASAVPENPEVTKLKEINKTLSERNQCLKDSVDDAKLELRQMKERISGPLKRELERSKRKSIEAQCKCAEAIDLNGNDLRNKELAMIKEQLETVCTNIADLHTINAEIRQEVLVLNYMCKKMQELLIKNKMEEINALKNLTSPSCACK